MLTWVADQCLRESSSVDYIEGCEEVEAVTAQLEEMGMGTDEEAVRDLGFPDNIHFG